MLKIKVEHNIGDIVVSKLNDKQFLVIGYKYIDGGHIEYVVIEPVGNTELYMYGCEVKKKGKERTIGFETKKTP